MSSSSGEKERQRKAETRGGWSGGGGGGGGRCPFVTLPGLTYMQEAPFLPSRIGDLTVEKDYGGIRSLS